MTARLFAAIDAAIEAVIGAVIDHAALLPLWLLSAGGWAAFVAAHWLTGGVR